MNIEEYNRVVDKILMGLNQNEKIIIEAFKTELQDYGHKIDIKFLEEILKEKPIELEEVKDNKVALYYSGNTSITLYFILLAIKNDFSVTLFNERYDVFNNCLVTIIEEVLKELKIHNTYFKYDEKYNEKFLVDNQNEFDRIIFIGDYFEYKNLKHYIKKEMVYDNFGFMKGFIEQEKYIDEYKKIMKYCYIHNIDMDFYTDEDEFIEEVSENDKVIILTSDEQQKENIKTKISRKDVMFEFPYEQYKFNMNEFIKKF